MTSHSISNVSSPDARVGVFGIGLEADWPQFAGNSLLTARGVLTSGEADIKTNLAQLLLDRLGAGGELFRGGRHLERALAERGTASAVAGGWGR